MRRYAEQKCNEFSAGAQLERMINAFVAVHCSLFNAKMMHRRTFRLLLVNLASHSNNFLFVCCRLQFEFMAVPGIQRVTMSMRYRQHLSPEIVSSYRVSSFKLNR